MVPSNKQRNITLLEPGLVLVDAPPVTMTVSTQRQGTPDSDTAIASGRIALELYHQLLAQLEQARCPVEQSTITAATPPVLQRMIRATCAMQERDFTPMAAVAGAFAAEVAAFAQARGCDRVLVNNGGDVAIVWPDGESELQVGVISDLALGRLTHRLRLRSDDGVNAVATSGFGGRSLTKGLANAVVILAADAAIADAAATAIANAVICPSSRATFCPAEELDPATDIAGQLVTCDVGRLSALECEQALANGSRRANQLLADGLISGALLFVQGQTRCLPQFWQQRLR